jgi:hypothetical protein
MSKRLRFHDCDDVTFDYELFPRKTCIPAPLVAEV